MNKNQVKGVAKQAVGKVEGKVGKVVGSPKLRASGLLKEIVGAFQKGYGDSVNASKKKKAARKAAARKSAAKKVPAKKVPAKKKSRK